MTHPHRTPELRPPCAPWTLARPTRPGRARSRTDGVDRASVDERQRETWTRRETRIIGVPYGSRTRVAAVKETRFSYPTEIGTISLPFVNWKHKPAVAANLWFKSHLTLEGFLCRDTKQFLAVS